MPSKSGRNVRLSRTGSAPPSLQSQRSRVRYAHDKSRFRMPRKHKLMIALLIIAVLGIAIYAASGQSL